MEVVMTVTVVICPGDSSGSISAQIEVLIIVLETVAQTF